MVYWRAIFRNYSSSSSKIISSPFSDVTLPVSTLPDFIWSKINKWPDKTAFECGITEKSLTYNETRKMSKRFGVSLLKSGLKSGDTVTLVLPNMSEFAVSMLGAMEAGLTVSAINPIYTTDEMKHQIEDSGSNCVVTHSELLKTVMSVLPQLRKKIDIICIDDFDEKSSMPNDVRSFNEMVDESISDVELDEMGVKIDIDDTAFIPYSSGTTGLPKGVCMTHRTLVTNLVQCCHPEINPLKDTSNNFQCCIPAILPLHHMYGFAIVMLRSLYHGSKIVLLPKFELTTFLSVLSKNKLSRWCGCDRLVFNNSCLLALKKISAMAYWKAIIRRYSSSSKIVKSPYNDVTLPLSTLPDFIWSKINKWPDKTAFECGITGKSLSYNETRKMSKRFGVSLLKSGLKPGDTATLILPNMVEFAVSMLGAMEAGVTISPINPIYSGDEIKHQIEDSGSKCVITHYALLKTVMSVMPQLKKKIDVICIDDFENSSLPNGVRPFKELIDESISHVELDKIKINIDETALLPYSSGTTGLPKGVCLTHRTIVANIAQICNPEYNTVNETNGSQCCVPAILPFFHIYGCAVVLLRSLRNGAKLVTLPKFEPTTFLNVLSKNKDVILHAVPPMIIFLGSHPSVTKEHVKNLRFTLTGAAPCGASDIAKLKAKKDHPIIQAYGMTEASPVLTHSRLDTTDTSTIGPPVSNTFGKVIDLETGETKEPNEIGELCFKGPQIMKGYHNRPEETRATVDEEGWLKTGDVGYFDKEGNCYILDRIKELIKVKGFQVPPAELEAILRQHPGLIDAAVTSLPCSKSGEVPVAFVVSKPGVPIPSSEDVKKFVAGKVAEYKKIAHVIFIETIPKNVSGKILRRELKKQAQDILKK